MEQSLPKLGAKGATRCAVCNIETVLKCQGCVQRGTSDIRYYCGRDHQTMDWKSGHKNVCYVSKGDMENLIYQFRITLVGVEPPIWRQIQLRKDSTFRDLHKAISLSMGWFESHLHEFRMQTGQVIGMPNEDNVGIPEKTAKLATHFKKIADRCVYEYDFGDSWTHDILLENICPLDEAAEYPTCVGGARACPPEDAGGVYGYAEIIKAYQTPPDSRTKGEKEKLKWVENHPFGYSNFDPDRFSPSQVKWNMFNSKVWEK